MIDELELVRQVRPDAPAPGEEATAAARRQLEEAIGARPHRLKRRRHGRFGIGRARHLESLIPVLGALIVVGVVALFLGLHRGRPPAGSGTESALRLVFSARPTVGVPTVDDAAMRRAVEIVRLRLSPAVPGAAVSRAGHELIVRVPARAHVGLSRLLTLAGEPGRLIFYDWEANALTPSGRPVAELLRAQNPAALDVSQGGTSYVGAGGPGAGGMSLYRAVGLAAGRSARPSPENARRGPEYFAFGAAGSRACAKAHQHCYLAGPEDTRAELDAALPNGVNGFDKDVQVFEVRQGWVVLQAVSAAGLRGELAWGDPRAQYFVLRDQAALSGDGITDPRAATDQSGQPNVEFGFTATGGRAFQRLTATIAHRGARVSGFGQRLNQHFALALDTQLISVPQIDYEQYPDGISGSNGADVSNAFTPASARLLAAELRLGPLPVALGLVSVGRG